MLASGGSALSLRSIKRIYGITGKTGVRIQAVTYHFEMPMASLSSPRLTSSLLRK